MRSNSTSGPVFYGWVVVGVTSLVLLITAGTRTAPGAFLLDMEADTGWSKGLLSLAAAVGLVVFGLAGPVSGALWAATAFVGRRWPRCS